MSLGVKLRDEGSFITRFLHSKPPVLESAFPLNEALEQGKIWKKMKENVIVCPLQEIREYYGTVGTLSFWVIGRCHNKLQRKQKIIKLLVIFFHVHAVAKQNAFELQGCFRKHHGVKTSEPLKPQTGKCLSSTTICLTFQAAGKEVKVNYNALV